MEDKDGNRPLFELLGLCDNDDKVIAENDLDNYKKSNFKED